MNTSNLIFLLIGISFACKGLWMQKSDQSFASRIISLSLEFPAVIHGLSLLYNKPNGAYLIYTVGALLALIATLRRKAFYSSQMAKASMNYAAEFDKFILEIKTKRPELENIFTQMKRLAERSDYSEVVVTVIKKQIPKILAMTEATEIQKMSEAMHKLNRLDDGIVSIQKNRFWKIVTNIMAVLVVISVLIAVGIYSIQKMLVSDNPAAVKFVANKLPEIIDNWNSESLLANMGTDYQVEFYPEEKSYEKAYKDNKKVVTTSPDIRPTFDILQATFGKSKQINRLICQDIIFMQQTDCLATATFEKGSAELYILLELSREKKPLKKPQIIKFLVTPLNRKTKKR